MTCAKRKAKRPGREGLDPPLTQARREQQLTVDDRPLRSISSSSGFERIQVHAHALPVRTPLQNLAVRSSDAVPSLEACARRNGIRLHVREYRARLEQRYEPERRNPPQVTCHQQRQVPDVRDGHDRDTPTERARRANRSAWRDHHVGSVFGHCSQPPAGSRGRQLRETAPRERHLVPRLRAAASQSAGH